jgi:hypothetical protein
MLCYAMCGLTTKVKVKTTENLDQERDIKKREMWEGGRKKERGKKRGESKVSKKWGEEKKERREGKERGKREK